MELLSDTLDRLASFEPGPFPVVSLYLNAQPDQHGRNGFEPFLRKAFKARAKTFAPASPEFESFERDVERIRQYLQRDLRPSSNGVAIFACAGAGDFFEAVQTEAPIDADGLYVDHQPHLYPLVRLTDRYRPYGVLLANTNAARILVFGLGRRLFSQELINPKVKRMQAGGWSQARYQRHVENYHLQHAKEIVDALDRMVTEDEVEHIFIAGDEVIVPVIREQLPPRLADRIADVLRLDMSTSEQEVLRATLEAMQEQDASDDAQKVDQMLEQYRAGGLAVVGRKATMAALVSGQVDELLLGAILEPDVRQPTAETGAANEMASAPSDAAAITADALVARARQTGAGVTIIENPALLAPVEGVGATLRFRV
ncbi:MAG: host attachment protein [Acidobacteria bacterium]|nr:host attachment protein [Acidobacteriota bacterium]